jgi:protein-disulfide isomerase
MSDTKKARREHAREVAREMREKERKRRQRTRLVIQGGVVLGILAVVAVVVIVIVSVNAPAGPGPRTMATGAIVFGANADKTGVAVVEGEGSAEGASLAPVKYDTSDGVVQVDAYVDWACPMCKTFEESFGEQLRSLAASGAITLATHPVAILDHNYGKRYSSRAANVAACVANYAPGSFLDVQKQFFDNQPEEGSDGLDTDAILDLVKAGGVDDADVTRCIRDESYKSWVRATTDAVTADKALANPETGGFGTPTVLVNGERLDNPGTLVETITAAATAEGAPAPVDQAPAPGEAPGAPVTPSDPASPNK